MDDFSNLSPRRHGAGRDRTSIGQVGQNLVAALGMGDHGGGPTRQDITRAKAYDELPCFPKMKFTTAEKFYRSLRPGVPKYKVYKGELQYIFEGCYTSIARIKEGNRKAENTLYTGELLSALGSLAE